ncbi:hypothetical protein ASF47_19980 [Nocardioides sp. Leaf285]|nr:hypothetical protein ASF47_19980 [Nocardioides sp. Leaf285]
MERRLRELDRLDQSHGLGASPTHRPVREPWGARRRTSRPRRERRTHGPVLPGLLVAVVVTTLLLMRDPGAFGNRMRDLLGRNDRLGDLVGVEDTGGSYDFSLTQRGGRQPVSWNPCEPITYVVNPAGAPQDWEVLVSESVAEIEGATGFRFSDEGVTDDRDFERRESLLGRPAPVLIGWSDDEEVPRLAGDVAGLGGSATSQGLGRRYYVTGMVALDTDVYDRLADEPGGREQMRAILVHELGHVVGLGHVDDPEELMNADNLGRTTLGEGDREGLARLGSVPCS